MGSIAATTAALVLSACAGEEPEHGIAASAEALVARPSDAALAAAANCTDCKVLHRAETALAQTKARITSAKLVTADGDLVDVAISPDGKRVDKQRLLSEERRAHGLRYGKRSPELANALSRLDPQAPVSVAIWLAIPAREYPRKEEMTAEQFANEAQAVKEVLGTKSSPVRAFLQAKQATVREDGTTAPIIRTQLAPRDFDALEALPEVAYFTLDAGAGRHTNNTWFFSSGSALARNIGTGVGQGICNIEGEQPDSYAQLNVAGVSNSSAATNWHIRWTTGIMANTNSPATSLATGASMYIGAWDGYPGPGTVENWCASRAQVWNFSHSFSSGAPGGQDVVDWLHDWYAVNNSFVLVAASSGNEGNVANFDTVQNRRFNGLVVGGSDDKGTTGVTDDTIWDGSSWRNFSTPHNDYELPHLIAPAVNVTAVGSVGTGTSASAPQVAAAAAAMIAMDPGSFTAWPEMTRAVLQASPLTALNLEGFLSALPSPVDRHTGTGLLHAARAVALSSPQYYNVNNAANGRYRQTVTFATDFDANNIWTKTFTTSALSTSRFRAVLTWDATPGGCDAFGNNCTGSTIDGDLDLGVTDNTSGLTAWSMSYDSTYEVLDFAVTPGRTYTIKVKKHATSRSSTYVGLAWTAYN
jgi:hypothetical protein